VLPRSLSDRIAQTIDSVLLKLVPRTPVSEVTREYSIDELVRGDILRHLEQLDTELATKPPIIEAWRDLLSSAGNVKRTIEEVAFRRDTLYAIAHRRSLDVTGPFGVFADLRRLITDVPTAVQEELDAEAGHDHVPTFPPASTPSLAECRPGGA
jgi:hypothetical protein